MALKREVELLQRQSQEHADILENIRNAPEDQAWSIFQQLRMTENAAAVLSSYQGQASSSSQISEHDSARTDMPSTESGIECELLMLHPTAYPQLTPPSPSSIATARLIGDSTQASSSCSIPLSPSIPSAYCDPRLEHLTVRYWTRIPIDDGLAARALSQFLESDHAVLGLFDADLFLGDLVAQCLNFCSTFLFHSVMSLACVCPHCNLQ